MLSYTFSTREKFMLALLLVIGLGVAWFQLLYTPLQTQIRSIDSQIADTQDKIVKNQVSSASYAKMRKEVEEFQAAGAKLVLLPAFDNTQNLMAHLNGIMAATKDYTIEFEDPVEDSKDGSIHRAGTIQFGVNTYAEARQIIDKIANGPYPCSFTAVGIQDKTAESKAKSNRSTTKAPVNCTLEITYYEGKTSNTKITTQEKAKEGQDLSVLTKWDK